MTPTAAKATRRNDPDIFIDAREALDRLPTAPGEPVSKEGFEAPDDLC